MDFNNFGFGQQQPQQPGQDNLQQQPDATTGQPAQPNSTNLNMANLTYFNNANGGGFSMPGMANPPQPQSQHGDAGAGGGGAGNTNNIQLALQQQLAALAASQGGFASTAAGGEGGLTPQQLQSLQQQQQGQQGANIPQQQLLQNLQQGQQMQQQQPQQQDGGVNLQQQQAAFLMGAGGGGTDSSQQGLSVGGGSDSSGQQQLQAAPVATANLMGGGGATAGFNMQQLQQLQMLQQMLQNGAVGLNMMQTQQQPGGGGGGMPTAVAAPNMGQAQQQQPQQQLQQGQMNAQGTINNLSSGGGGGTTNTFVPLNAPAGLGTLGGGGGGGLDFASALAANPQLAALMAAQAGQQQPVPTMGMPGMGQMPQSLQQPQQTPQGFGGSVRGIAKPPEAADSEAPVEWAEPFAGKGKKEPPFPLKLHQILSNPEFSECICWNPHGRSWRILKPPVFEQVVIPLYFRHAKYASFMRQVNGWGFKRIVSGNDHNSYYHEMFVRDMPQLCLKMKRIKKGEEKGKEDADEKDAAKDTPAAMAPAPPIFPAASAGDALAGLTGNVPGGIPAGLDSATILKLQEALAAAGGTNVLTQQQAAPVPQNGFAGFQMGGPNAALLAAQLQAATQKSHDDKGVSPDGDSEAV